MGDWYFPDVEPGQQPLGSRVLVQLRRVKRTTASGIIITEETRDHERYNTQIARVVSTGPIAFKRWDNMESWPEGTWVEIGDFVRVPKFGGDRFEVKIKGEENEPVVFMLLNDRDLIAKVTGDPNSYYDCVTV